ncbi:MAG: hypothetical protein HYV27_01925 [Candidatus Hydrogenedentes bacterium]|nr:hypothetical protein [Candidatus Hydrogenedentota bacterium]
MTKHKAPSTQQVKRRRRAEGAEGRSLLPSGIAGGQGIVPSPAMAASGRRAAGGHRKDRQIQHIPRKG